MPQSVDIPSELDLPDDVMLTEEDVWRAAKIQSGRVRAALAWAILFVASRRGIRPRQPGLRVSKLPAFRNPLNPPPAKFGSP